MITLNIEQGLIDLDSWDDLLTRPGFIATLDPKEHELHGVIGRYHEFEKQPCGLTECRTPHLRGYVVTTKEGLLTNIGKDCGKKYFGVEFENMSRDFDRRVSARD